MARRPVGKVAQRESRTALFAAVTARLEGIPAPLQSEYFRENLGLAVGRDAAEKAASPHRASSPAKRLRGRRGKRKPKRSNALRDWLLVDEPRFGLGRALVVFPGEGQSQTELRKALEQLPGIRQILELGHARDLVAVVLFSDFSKREELRARFAELTDRQIWDEVIHETHQPAIRTWRALSRDAAAEEELRLLEE